MPNNDNKKPGGSWGMTFLGIQLMCQAAVLVLTQVLKGTPYLNDANYILAGLTGITGIVILLGK